MKIIFQTISLLLVITYSIIGGSQIDLVNTEIYMLDSLVIANILLSGHILLYSWVSGIKKNFALFGFTLSFAVFNFGSYLFNMGSPNYGIHIFQAINYISYTNVAKSLIFTYIALLTYFISYIIFKKFKLKYKFVFKKGMKKATSHDLNRIRAICKRIMYIGSIFAFIKLGNEILFVFQNGYNAYYLSSSYNIPIIDLFDGLYLIGFWGFIATIPTMREIKKPIVIFLLYLVATLFMGKRGIFITNLLTIVWYLMKWDSIKQNKKVIFTRARMVRLAILSFFVLILMQQVAQIRAGYSSNIGDSKSLFLDAFATIEGLGFSGKTLALAVEYKERLGIFNSVNILFNPIIRYILNNAVVRLLGSGYTTINNPVILNKVGTFSGMLTYLSNPIAFTNGGGVGSNYLAELYISYGVLSLILFNILLGYILFKMDNITVAKWQSRFLLIYVFNIFMFLPRSQTFEFIPALVLPTLVSFLILFVTMNKKTNLSKDKVDERDWG